MKQRTNQKKLNPASSLLLLSAVALFHFNPLAGMSSAFGNEDLITCAGPAPSKTLIPAEIGFCELAEKKSVNEKMLVNENENLSFTLKMDKLIEGKFQMANKMVDGPDFAAQGTIGDLGKEPAFKTGKILMSKVAFLMENPEANFYTVAYQLNKDFLESYLHRTTVSSTRKLPHSYLVPLHKSILVKVLFFNKVSEMDMDGSVSIYDSKTGKWQGEFEGQDQKELLATASKLDQGDKLKLENPNNVIVLKLENPTDNINGGKTVTKFHKINIGGVEKTLVVSYNLISLNVGNQLVSWVMNKCSDLVFKNVKRETGKYVDASRGNRTSGGDQDAE